MGITPACAGKSVCRLNTPITVEDHPRMRGEKVEQYGFLQYIQGSPPHARGKERRLETGKVRQGITPACAGKSHILKTGDSMA